MFQNLKKQVISTVGNESSNGTAQDDIEDTKKREQNLQAIKGTPLEKLCKDFLEAMKAIAKGGDRNKIKDYIFTQSKSLINILPEIVSYDIIDCEQYKTSGSKVAKFDININMRKKYKEYILLARPLPSTGEWRIYSFEDRKKILSVLRNWSDLMKNFSEKGIMKSSPSVPLEIGVALMQFGEDDSAVNYLTKALELDKSSDEYLAAQVCLSIIRGKGK